VAATAPTPEPPWCNACRRPPSPVSLFNRSRAPPAGGQPGLRSPLGGAPAYRCWPTPMGLAQQPPATRCPCTRPRSLAGPASGCGECRSRPHIPENVEPIAAIEGIEELNIRHNDRGSRPGRRPAERVKQIEGAKVQNPRRVPRSRPSAHRVTFLLAPYFLVPPAAAFLTVEEPLEEVLQRAGPSNYAELNNRSTLADSLACLSGRTSF